MFYVIKHVKTDSYVPFTANPKARSNYFAFLDGKESTTKYTFKTAHFYRHRELAEQFIQKIINSVREVTLTEDDFVIEEYKHYPIDQLVLHYDHPSTRIKIAEDPRNWQDKSRMYCDVCGSLIPNGIKHLNIGFIKMCSFCVFEIYTEIKESVDQYDNPDVIKAIFRNRFISKL